MHLHEIKTEKTSRLKKRLAQINKAIRGNQEWPNGLSLMWRDSIDMEYTELRAELKRRRQNGDCQ